KWFCDILKEIEDAQRYFVVNCCDISCEQSISVLLFFTDHGNGLDTVPIILYCKDVCKPFKGYFAHPDHIGHMQSSFYFRVKKVSDDCCASLELLRYEHCDAYNSHDPME